METPAGRRRADALGLVAESALAANLDGGIPGDRYQIVVHVDTEVLREDGDTTVGQSALEDGSYVSAETSRRMECDAATVVMRHRPDGRALDVRRKTRTVSPALRRALAARDRHCRFPGYSVRHCDTHHIRHWADGGSMELDNMLLLCRHHHRSVHEEEFSVEAARNGALRFFFPHGRRLPDAPSAPFWIGPPLEPLRSHLQSEGVTIGPDAATRHWHGKHLNEGWAIDVLWRPRRAEGPLHDGSTATRQVH